VTTEPHFIASFSEAKLVKRVDLRGTHAYDASVSSPQTRCVHILKTDPDKTVARDELMRLHGDETVHFSVMRYDDPGSKLPTGKVTFSCPGTWEILLSYRHIEMTLATAQTFKSYLKRQAPSEASTPLMEQWRFLGFYTAVPVTVSLAFESDQGLRSSP